MWLSFWLYEPESPIKRRKTVLSQKYFTTKLTHCDMWPKLLKLFLMCWIVWQVKNLKINLKLTICILFPLKVERFDPIISFSRSTQSDEDNLKQIHQWMNCFTPNHFILGFPLVAPQQAHWAAGYLSWGERSLNWTSAGNYQLRAFPPLWYQLLINERLQQITHTHTHTHTQSLYEGALITGGSGLWSDRGGLPLSNETNSSSADPRTLEEAVYLMESDHSECVGCFALQQKFSLFTGEDLLLQIPYWAKRCWMCWISSCSAPTTMWKLHLRL